jgi:hypothetical protein|tara:strand:- start:334 stop:561 length:228 start_codon:yes stop_codon:yes gene_type:complete
MSSAQAGIKAYKNIDNFYSDKLNKKSTLPSSGIMGSAKGSTTKESSSKLDDANAIVARIVMNIRKQTEELKNGRG